MRKELLILFVLIAVAVPSAAVVASGEPPLADAGLDQTVTHGTTVHLDGGGSHAPDGEIASYEWTIESPDGEPVTPTVPEGETTTFEAADLGTYTVTLTVTDDEGRSAEDTLYVEVVEGDPPTVTLDAPAEVNVGSEAAFDAAVTQGDAPLDRIEWHVDGESVTSDAPGPAPTHHRTFESLGERTVTVTVVDDAGLTATATHTVTVVEPDEESSGGGGDGGTGGWYDGIASSDDATIDGPRTITGERPLTATHTVDSSYASRIDDVTWRVDGDGVATGSDLQRSWEPGTHNLTALVEYDDGTQAIATFPDGDREVFANPQPVVEFESLGGADGRINGVVLADEEPTELRAIEVRIDGDTVHTWLGDGSDRRTEPFEYDDVEQGDVYEVTAVAVDDRGQEATVTESVEVVGTPEIVSAEVVNDPVDSYHERIDPDRYTAELEVVVEPNGWESEDYEIMLQSRETINEHDQQTKYHNGSVHRTFYVSSDIPGEFKLNVETQSKEMTTLPESESVILNVTESPPEANFKISVDPEGPAYGNRRILIDPMDSFDPDWGVVEFSTNGDKHSARPLKVVDMPFRSELNLLFVDSNNNTEVITEDMSEYYSPELNEQSIKSDEVLASETVYIIAYFERHTTDREAFQVAELDLELVDTDGTIVDFYQEQGTTNTNQTNREVGIVRVPAEEFLSGTDPEIAIYNKKNPDQTERVYELNPPQIVTDPDVDPSEVVISDQEYLVVTRNHDIKNARSSSRKAQLLRRGYSVTDTMAVPQYVIEEQIEHDPVYERDSRTFDTRAIRDTFIDGEEHWTRAGTETTTRTVTETETEWRRSKDDSEFTGNTREVLVEPAKYTTQHKYAYETTETYTTTRRVRETTTVERTVTRTETVTVCYSGVCHDLERTYTETVTETRSYWTTKTVTRTRTVTETYWSSSRTRSSHWHTGETREIRVSDPVYATEYEHEFEVERQVTDTQYVAEKEKLVQPGGTEWQRLKTVESESVADLYDDRDGFRHTSTETETEWTLQKLIGTEQTWTTDPNEGSVVSTRADLYATLATTDSDKSEGAVTIGEISETIQRNDELSEEEVSDLAEEKAESADCEFVGGEFRCVV